MKTFLNALTVTPLRYLLLFTLLILIGCKKDKETKPPEPEPEGDCSFMLNQLEEAEEQATCTAQFTELNYVQIETVGDKDTSFIVRYTIDNCGKVIEENYDSRQQYVPSYTSEFKYNEAGQVIKELRNGVIYRYVEWTGNQANVFDKLCNKWSAFIFENDRMVQHTYGEPNFGKVEYTLEYDNAGHVISIEDTYTGVPSEFLEFNTEVENPFYLLNSISILRFELRPFMQFTHGIEKRNEYQILDVLYTLAFFDVTYELDSIGRVSKIDNERYRFRFTNEFSYD